MLVAPKQYDHTTINLPLPKMTIRTLLSLSAAALALSGCGQAAIEERTEQAIERETGGQADVDLRGDGSMRIDTKDGTVEIGRQALPSDWPTEIGTYPGSTIVTTANVTSDKGRPASMITATTGDSAAKIATYFKDRLAADGWEINAEAVMGAMTIIGATKADQEFGMQIVTAENQSTISLVVSKS